MKTNVKQWGNSVAVRIPQPFAKEIGMIDGTQIEIKLIDKKIILSKPKLTLKSLLEKVKPKNTHAETDTGTVHGKEEW
jgi:antitoxin MazE